jgi:hypothetical protein
MTEAAFDRRLRDWLEGRDPGPVPMTLRESVERVPVRTPVPAVSRVWQAIVGPGAGGRRGSPLRLVLALVLLGLLLAAAFAGVSTSGRPTAPLTSWHDYVVGQPAPDLDFGSVAGALRTGDSTISVDDLPEAMFVLYFPRGASSDRTAADARLLIKASEQVPNATAFLVIAPDSAPIARDTASLLHDAGMMTAAPPAGWDADASSGEPALVITGRGGVVKYVFAGGLPDADQLIGDLDRASVL